MTGVEIVAIGVSLGGLKALERILPALPAGFRPPLIVVQHRRHEESRLEAILQRHCALPVSEPGDRTRIEGSRVYLAPSGYHLLVDREVFWLSVDPPVSHARPSIDVLFESLAAAYGAGALAIVLTGSSDDGAAGAKAIKGAGGRVFVQEPGGAESPVAPRAALATTTVDGVLSIEAIAALLARL
jgi:two-component system chemotaxis response regulator CheB